MKYIIVLALAICLFVSSCTRCVAPPDAVPGQISISPDTNSPYWISMIKNSFTKSLNKKACYQIATDQYAPYVLKVRVLNADSYMSGLSYSQYGASVNYRNRVEVEYTLFNDKGDSIYGGSAWAESGGYPMNTIAQLVAKDLYKKGMLDPDFYKEKPPFRLFRVPKSDLFPGIPKK